MAADVVELARVETIQPGDEIEVGKRGRKVVSAVNVHDDESVVVCYFNDRELVYENRARDKSGFHEVARLVEISIVPMRVGDVFPVRRGEKIKALGLRKQMEREQAERARAAENRWRRASER